MHSEIVSVEMKKWLWIGAQGARLQPLNLALVPAGNNISKSLVVPGTASD